VYHPNPNFVISADQTNASPTTIHVRVEPQSGLGRRLTGRRRRLHRHLEGAERLEQKFQAASTEGYDSIASVTPGADKFDYTVTWKGPTPTGTRHRRSGTQAESVKDPDTFNSGWSKLNNDWLSGPFKVEKFDETQKVLTEVPNDKWWGDKPLLDKIIYRAISPDAWDAAFVNNELDSFDIGPDPDAFKRASGVQDATVRKAAGPNFRHITFNIKAGLLTDKVVRQSIVRAWTAPP
jgi:peptide/nickel transport system substrate-binding protein